MPEWPHHKYIYIYTIKTYRGKSDPQTFLMACHFVLKRAPELIKRQKKTATRYLSWGDSLSFLETDDARMDNASESESYSKSCRVHAPFRVSPVRGSAFIAEATSPYATNFHSPFWERGALGEWNGEGVTLRFECDGTTRIMVG